MEIRERGELKKCMVIGKGGNTGWQRRTPEMMKKIMVNGSQLGLEFFILYQAICICYIDVAFLIELAFYFHFYVF